MIQATAPLKVRDKRLLVVPIVYAVGLVALTVVQLIGFGGFDFAGIKIDILGPAWVILVLAAVEIFALPFLLGLRLSRLARACSAALALAAPILYLVFVVFIRDQTTAPVTSLELITGSLLGIAAISSFNILGGEQALKGKS
jgi:hypothetical protein